MSGPTDPRRDSADHGEWDALAVGWALSALEPDDEARFAVHLPECDRCTETVRESLRTVGDLAYAVPDEAPPPSLKARIMEAAAAEPRRRPEPPGRVGLEIAGGPGEGQWPLGSALAEPDPGAADWFARPHGTPAGDAADGGARPPDLPGPRPGSAGAGFDARPRRPGDDLTGPADLPAAAPGRAAPGEDVAGRGHPSAGGAGRVVPGGDVAGREQPSTGAAGGVPGPAAPGEDGAGRAGGSEARGRFGGPGTSGHGRHAAPDDGGEHPPDLPPNVVPLDSRRRRWTRRIAVAAVVALIAALGAWNLRLRADQDDLRQVVAQRNAAIEQLTRGGPARVAALTADGKPSPQRRATVVVRGDRIEIITEGLDASDRVTYWLWALKCDVTDLQPVQGFQLTGSRFSVQSIGSDADAAGAPCFAVSEELGSARPAEPREVVALGAAK